MRSVAVLLCMVSVLTGCAVGTRVGVERAVIDDVASIEALLDSFHIAAKSADGNAYFGCMAADGVFIGTDPTERWTRSEFAAYCRPYFDDGIGWEYRPHDRHVTIGPLGDDGTAGVAWFDEHLDNDKYGLCRGSGVVVRTKGGWRIASYRLGLEVPNDAAAAVVSAIAAHAGPVPAAARATTVILVRHAEKRTDGADPGLTEAGERRVERLAAMLASLEIDAVYATRTKRTRSTVAPIASRHVLEVIALDPLDNEGLVERIIADHAGQTVLVCGHSNTLPAIIDLLGAPERVTMNDSQYDDVYIVVRPAAGPTVVTRLSSASSP